MSQLINGNQKKLFKALIFIPFGLFCAIRLLQYLYSGVNDFNLLGKSPLIESQIFDEWRTLTQNDPLLLNYIRKNVLIPPSDKPYNLSDPTGDPSINEGQNKYVLHILNNMTFVYYISDKMGGFFIECGAWDGERLSTTLVLERDFGWKGFMAEPNRESFAKLVTKNRKAWIANICLSTTNRPQLVNFGEVHSDGFLPAHSSIQKYLSIHDNIVVTKTPCFPIFSVLSALHVTIVDFFTLDIEGAELDVLKTIPFDHILIKIFCIEWNHVPEGKEELRLFVESKGYILVKDIAQATASDFIFVHKSVPPPPLKYLQ